MKILLIVVALFLVTACAPWVKTDGTYTAESQGFAVDLPAGWMRRNTDTLLLISKDGPLLQQVIVARKNITDETQFANTKKRISRGMLPHELAETVIDDYQSDPNNPFDEAEENVPENVAGHQGFKVRLTYSTKDGLKYRCLIYGVLVDEWFYEFIYVAPARHYFDKDLAVVQHMAGSFKLTRK